VLANSQAVGQKTQPGDMIHSSIRLQRAVIIIMYYCIGTTCLSALLLSAKHVQNLFPLFVPARPANEIFRQLVRRFVVVVVVSGLADVDT